MAGLVGYGGDPRVVASREEILRIESLLGAIALDLVAGSWQLLPNPVQRTQLNLHLPDLEYRLHKTRLALGHAAESYFTTDAKISHSVEALGNAMQHNPWLANLIRKDYAVAAFAVAQFAPGTFGAQATRGLASAVEIPKGVIHDREVNYKTVASTKHRGVYNLNDIGVRLDELNTQTRQVRVETYLDSSGQKTMLVYIPGTQSFNPAPSSNPFDPTTDAMLVTTPEKSELLKAIGKALEQAGAKDCNLVLAGYSLGGIAAANLTALGEFNVTGVITVGSPVATTAIPGDVPVLSIEHSNDPIPAATGESNPLTKNWATASRQLQLEPGTPAIKAHELDSYRVTMSMTDNSAISGVQRVRELILDQVVGKQLVREQTFEFSR